jgi:hypothetical protein
MPQALEQKFETLSGQDVPAIPPNRAVSIRLPFVAIKNIEARITQLKRPNRNHPIHVDELNDELSAWDSASDEAWNSIED